MMNTPALVCFDLDDTLYKERDYLRSGHRVVAGVLADATGADAGELFTIINSRHPLGIEAAIAFLAERGITIPYTVDELVEIYRNHKPDIPLSDGVEALLTGLKAAGHRLVLITDGSSRHQRAKFEALGLNRFFDPECVIISGETGADKHTPVPFALAEALGPGLRRYYIGDNMAKDFFHPNRRGWTSVMLLDTTGENVKPQIPSQWDAARRPAVTILDIQKLKTIII